MEFDRLCLKIVMGEGGLPIVTEASLHFSLYFHHESITRNEMAASVLFAFLFYDGRTTKKERQQYTLVIK